MHHASVVAPWAKPRRCRASDCGLFSSDSNACEAATAAFAASMPAWSRAADALTRATLSRAWASAFLELGNRWLKTAWADVEIQTPLPSDQCRDGRIKGVRRCFRSPRPVPTGCPTDREGTVVQSEIIVAFVKLLSTLNAIVRASDIGAGPLLKGVSYDLANQQVIVDNQYLSHTYPCRYVDRFDVLHTPVAAEHDFA